MLDEIERLAKAATPGPWECAPGDAIDHWELWNPKTTEYVVQDDSGVEPRFEDISYIAAANPETVLKLIAVVKAALNEIKHEPGNKLLELREALAALEEDS